MVIEAFGDPEVANVSTEVLTRTLKALLQHDSITLGCSVDVMPL